MNILKTLLFASIALWGCKPTEQGSNVKITNGVEDKDNNYSHVVNLGIVRSGNRGAICTGTFVSDTTLITAAHCVVESGKQLGDVRLSGFKGKKALKILAHPKFLAVPAAKHDLAVIIFEADSSKKYSNVSKEQPRAEAKIVIAGFGNNDHIKRTGNGTKRIGHNTLAANKDGLLTFTGGLDSSGGSNGENAASSQGDSGGPMFIENILVGVVSGGRVLGDQKESTYANISFSENIDFLKNTMTQGAKIPSLEDAPTYNRDLFLAIGRKTEKTQEKYQLFFAATDTIAKVNYCPAIEGKPGLCLEGAPGLSTTKINFDLANRKIFESTASLHLEDNRMINIAALDDQGNLVSARTIRFGRQ